jgi:polyisoprenoid-binding protein YceI
MAAMTTTETTALPLAPGRWALDPNHSSIDFTIRHLGVSKVRGRFRRFEVDVAIGTTLEDTSVDAVVDLASIDTGNKDRDAHVLQPDMLDIEKRPTLTFRSTRITGGGGDWQVHGDATIGDVTRPLTLDVEFGGIEHFVDGSRHAGFEASGELRRKDFGIDIALPPGVSGVMLGDAIKFTLDIQLVEPAA